MELLQVAIASVVASAATGGIVGVIAKILLDRAIEHKLKLIETKQNIVWQNEIAYRQAQLEELYGPIYAMLKTSGRIYKLWNINKKIYGVNFDVKKYFEHNNEEIRRILTQKMHLIDGKEMPPQFVDFMTSAMLWNWYCAKDADAHFPPDVEKLDEVKWPPQFEAYIYEKTEALKRRLDELYRKYSIE